MNGCRRTQLLAGAACAAVLPLAACGGSGARPGPIAPPEAGTPTPPPAPAPSPSPSPTPAPPPTNYNDAEYQRSSAATAANALTAYQNGGTGAGVKIAIVDSGINRNLSEFAGRIDAASQNLHDPGPVTATDFHGTAVAGVAAAARNGSGNLGVAFDATIIALNSANPNNCAGDDGCVHNDADIARGIDIARTNGARVINISLGGEGASSGLAQALSRATQAGIVVVFSSGNEGEANPNQLALSAGQQAGNGLVIIAGALNGQGNMASYSSRAGTAANLYLTTFADGVRTFDETGQAITAFGTSFASPVISGAAAVLADAFPNLSGAQIVDLLLRSADDLGATGTDSTYGRGRLNLTRAFQPQGQLSLAGGVPVAIGDGGEASAAMGDAVSGQRMGAVILDGYSRAFAVDLAQRMTRAAQQQPLAQALHGDVRSAVSATGPVSVALTVSRNLRGEPLVGLAQAGLGYEDARQARALAGYAVGRLTPRTAVAFGFSESGRTLQQRLAGRGGNAFLVVRDPMSRHGFVADASNGLAVRHSFGAVGLTASSETGSIWNYDYRRRLDRPGYTISALGIDGRVGPAWLSLGASRLGEQETVLGGRFASALVSGGARSWFVDGGAALTLGGGWDAEAGYRRGWTSMRAGPAADAGGQLRSQAWFFDLGKSGALWSGDRLALRVAQPLRVASGGFALTLPTSYDYASGSVGYQARFFNLAPSGREIDFEAAYGVALGAGALDLNAYLRRQPGHIAAAGDDRGTVLRYRVGF